MSRAKHQDSENAVQLFPFVAVLLCTMGSLLVLLVSVARTSKEHAAEAAVAAQATVRAANAARAAESRRKSAASKADLEKVAKYQAEVDSVTSKAEKQLRDDQERLTHLEDHMRRLREQLEALKLAAEELNSREGEHVDDHKLAQAEIERLHQLIQESRQTIERLREEAKSRAKAYAIVPYKGRSGTHRRPIYIECLANEVILQPEGVVFTEDDFRPPIGPGNALAAALRAAREHILQFESGAAVGEAAKPYPLIIVRPQGIAAYYCVREAIQSWDDEFGYELVEEDWELNYAAANPQLATKEAQAADLARARLRSLAAAAPQAYGAYRSGGGFAGPSRGSDDDEGGPLDDGGNGGAGGGMGQGGGTVTVLGGGPATARNRTGNAPAEVASSDRYASRPLAGQSYAGSERSGEGSSTSNGANGESKPTGGTESSYASILSSSEKPGGASRSAAGGASSGASTKSAGAAGSASAAGTQPSGGAHAMAGGQPSQPPGGEGRADGAPASGSYMAGDNPDQELDDLARQAAEEDDEEYNDDDADDGEPGAKRTRRKQRGKNWALANGKPGLIPIRRTIQIVVRNDALAIMPESSATAEASAAGREFQFAAAPEAAYEDLINAVEKRIKDWGIAGQGLYWRPVVELKISAGGEHRVDDLMRLLNFSGVEVRGGDVAQQASEGTGHASH